MPRLDAERIAAALAANFHQTRLQMLRCHRFGSWRPRIAFEGREHVERALAAGRGGILWVAPFVFSDLVTKMALHRQGLSVSHLSRPQHGLSPTPFGQRFFNPLWTSVERRYLGERLVMVGEGSRALRDLILRLRENRLVSISVGVEGARRRSLPFLGGTLNLADGAARLARRSGAALLPVFTVRVADGSFVTTVEAPPDVAANVEPDEATERLVAHEVALLESYVLRWPDPFVAWGLATPGEPSPRVSN